MPELVRPTRGNRPSPSPECGSFDRLATAYDVLEWLLAGRLLQRARTDHLPRVRTAHRVLLAGEGHGRFLPAAAAALPHAEFTVIDASAFMLARARQRWLRATPRLHNPARVRWIHGPIPDVLPSSPRFDLVVTQFFLDCFPAHELAPILHALARSAQPCASWWISDFRIPRNPFARLRARLILRLAYTFFRLTTRLRADRIEAPDPILHSLAFRRDQAHSYSLGLITSELWRHYPPPPSANLLPTPP